MVYLSWKSFIIFGSDNLRLWLTGRRFGSLTRRRLFWFIKGHVIWRNHFLHERCRHCHEQHCAVQRLARGRGNCIRNGRVKNGFKVATRLIFLKWFFMTRFRSYYWGLEGARGGWKQGLGLSASSRGGPICILLPQFVSFLILSLVW